METRADPLELLTIVEVADLFKAAVKTIRTWERTGRIPPALRIHGSLRWPRTQLEDWVAEGCPRWDWRNR